MWFVRYESPVGALTLVKRGDALERLALGACETAGFREDRAFFRAERAWLDAYFAGEPPARPVPLELRGTPFQLRVWKQLLTIPFGKTSTYGAIARAVGRPLASRAVGGANHHNPVAIIVPCHRVVGASGALVGFGGGLPMKEALLTHERVAARHDCRQVASVS